MACSKAESGEFLNGYIVGDGRGTRLRVRLEDGREIQAIPLMIALELAECPEALLINRPVKIRMHKHPKFPRIVWIGRPEHQI